MKSVMHPGQISKLRWYLITLLFLVTLINYVDRQTLSIAIPIIQDQYKLTNTDYSRIVLAFLLAYTMMQVVSGKLIDWMGTRKGFFIFFSWWSIAAILHGFVHSVMGFGICRFLLGMGEAGNWPGAVKAVAEWFPAKERSLAAGFFNSGSSVGAVVAPPLISLIILNFGWRIGFIATGALGMLWLVGWWFFYNTAERDCGVSEGERPLIRQGSEFAEHPDVPLSWFSLFRYRQTWALMLARVLVDPVWWFYVFWLPEYLKRQRAFSLAMIGMSAWIPFFAAGVGSFFGGGLCSFLIKLGWQVERARKAVLLTSASAMLAGIPAVLTRSAAWSLGFISIATFSYASFAAVFIALPTDIFPRQVVASVYGITGTAAGLGGMAFTLITGMVVDRFSYLPIFISAGVLPVLAAVVLLLLLGSIDPIRVATTGVAASPAISSAR
jgi:ACS family hexuronate transporter-like MFS transporter